MSLEKYRWDLVNCERCSMCKWVHPWSIKSKERARICPSMQKYKYDAYSAQGRFDLARALLEVDLNLRPVLKADGLLTRDPRKRERKKYGQPGARKRFQYSKR